MPLSSSVSRAVFSGNGVATSFPFNFKVWRSSDLTVSVEDNHGVTSIVTGWSVSLSENGGSVTYLHNGNPLPAGFHLAVLRNMPFVQEISLIQGMRFDPSVIETALDQATAERQQLREALERAVKMPTTSTDAPDVLVQQIMTARSEAQTAAGAAAASQQEAAASEQNGLIQAQNAALSAEQALASAEDAAVNADTAVSRVTAEGDRQVLRLVEKTTQQPEAEKIPQAGADGKLDAGWLPASFPSGYISFLPFRADELPNGWYCMNGELYPVNSTPGAALLALPETFRTDWGIAVSEDGITVNVPDWFTEDGRGPVMRAVNGSGRQIGSLENDGLPEISGGFNPTGLSSAAGTFGAFGLLDSTIVDYHSDTRSGYGARIGFWASHSNSIYGNSSYVTMLNRALTPAIFLGA